MSFYSVGFRATLGLAAFFSWNEPLILVKAFGAAGFFVAFFWILAFLAVILYSWPLWGLSAFSTAGFLAMGYFEAFGGTCPSKKRAC